MTKIYITTSNKTGSGRRTAGS